MGLLDTLMSGGYGTPDDEEEKKRRRMMGGMDDPNQTYGKVEQPKQPSWEEGGKFGWKDGLAMALTGIGDAFTRQGGGEGNALSTMMGNAMNARNASRKARIDAAKDQERSQQMMEIGRANGLTPEQVQAQMYGLELPKTERPVSQQDNAGNSWVKNPKTGEWQIDFIDPTQKVYNQGQSVVSIPNPFQGKNPREIPPIGSVVSATDIFGQPQQQQQQQPQQMPPDADMMHRMYLQQFGQRGESMFQEWLRNTQRK